VRNYRYFDLIMAASVAALLCSELIGVGKVSTIAGIEFGTAIIFFPVNFLFGDVITEVYGYARSRRVLWTGFVALLFATAMGQSVLAIPAAPSYTGQEHLEFVFGSTPRIVLATFAAMTVGEFVNSYVLARMKVVTKGRYLWMRTIGSTIAGEAVNTLLFYPIAFYGLWSFATLQHVMLSDYVIKVMWEVVATPLTYKLVSSLKRAEGEDYFDTDTNFTPFSMKV
jgi:queuosine precursor transporter